MSAGDDNVALVQRMRELWSSGERDAAMEYLDEDVVIDATKRELNPATYRGREGFEKLVSETEEVWESFDAVPERWEGVGPASVVVSGTYTARSRSGMELSERYGEVWTVDEGKVVHWDLAYPSHEDAVAAVREAGLAED